MTTPNEQNNFMRYAIIVLLMALTVPLVPYAQGQPPATINVMGKSKKLIMPDLAVFNVHISATDKDEAVAVKQMNDLVNETLGRLKKEGFTEQQIKLTGYAVNINYDYSQGKPRKVSYTAWQSFTVKFPMEKDRVLNIMNKLTANQSEGLQVSFYTDVSDDLKTKTSNDLVQQAIQDAKGKADMMAKAAGYRVKNVMDITYGVDLRQYPQPLMYDKRTMNMEAAQSGENANYFTVNEIEFNEEVKLTYAIETDK